MEAVAMTLYKTQAELPYQGSASLFNFTDGFGNPASSGRLLAVLPASRIALERRGKIDYYCRERQ